MQRHDFEAELDNYCDTFWQKHPTTPILVEAFLQGPLITVETIGDGDHLVALAGLMYRTTLLHRNSGELEWC
ncbi:hypothetical protein O9993_00400 [Vibrio lentus]|nr:hypothetical protein [Vibrio lentus]